MRNESFKKGFQLGKQEGLQEGRQEGLINAAKLVLNTGILTPDEIAKSLHLPLEEIKKPQMG